MFQAENVNFVFKISEKSIHTMNIYLILNKLNKQLNNHITFVLQFEKLKN